ncbi:MAG TPA: putative lipid II flippase FtsW [Solirubrobacteraceae bacterium]|nr:putative lipid II flippase FtsW [Solirubrobacteraceae bacterium]
MRGVKRRPPQPLEQRILLTATLCLLAAGAVMVYSASSARTLLQGQGDGTGYLIRYVVYGGLGLVALRLLSRGGLQFIRRITPLLVVASFVLVIAARLPGIGVRVNGASRWIGAGFVQFQPSELMKLSLLLFAVSLIAADPRRVQSLRTLTKPLLLVVGGGCLLVAVQPDLGTALVIAFSIAALLVAAGMPMRYLGILGGAGVVLVLLFALAAPYRAGRLTAFLNPWAHAGSTGFQAVQGQIAIGSGGLLGVGPGRSVQKIFYLPEAHTDFILAVIGEELGVLGVSVLLFLYGLIAYAGLRAAKAARSAYAKLLAAGLTSMIMCQATLNVFAVLGLAPLTGVPLPFVSYGASNLVILLAAMGLLINIAGGGERELRVVPSRRRSADTSGRHQPRWEDATAAGAHRDSRRRDRGARRAGAGGGAGTEG